MKSGRFAWRTWLADKGRLLFLSARILGGRRFWLWPIVTLAWPATLYLFVVLGWRETEFFPVDAQSLILGTPLIVLAISFGVQIIAGEIDRRTLEIAYTVPGGTHRVWLFKLAAGLMMLIAAEVLLAIVTSVFLTPFPWEALYGALQVAVFYMVLSMGFSALTRSEAAGAMLTLLVLVINFVFAQPFGVFAPSFNPETRLTDEPIQVLAATVRNRIGYFLAMAAIVALSFGRAEQRERLLG